LLSIAADLLIGLENIIEENNIITDPLYSLKGFIAEIPKGGQALPSSTVGDNALVIISVLI
jgi:hypothetical protein